MISALHKLPPSLVSFLWDTWPWNLKKSAPEKSVCLSSAEWRRRAAHVRSSAPPSERLQHYSVAPCTEWSSPSTLPLSAAGFQNDHRYHTHTRDLCCLQTVRATQSKPVGEKHGLGPERDFWNQVPSSQWCSQTCITVRSDRVRRGGRVISAFCMCKFMSWTITHLTTQIGL